MTPPSGSGGGFFLDVWVNGHHPVRMLLDTGASQTTVDSAWAKAAGLRVRDEAKVSWLGGVILEFGDTEQVELSVGGLTVRAVLSVINLAPLSTGLTEQGVTAIDGVLGDSFLHYFAAVIDYPGSRLYLLPPHLQVPTELAGTWRGVREEWGGKPVDPPSEWWVQFSAGQVQLTQDGVTLSCRPTFDASVGPKAVTLDLVINRKPVSYQGVYTVEGGRLRLCLRIDGPGGARPTGFATKPGDGCVFVEFERDPPDPPADQ
jgi:uncharacterized protein (TIGR03067 family)